MNLKSTFSLWTFVLLLILVDQSSSNQLSPSVLPINYNILIKLETDAFATDQFHGLVNITLDISNETEKIEIFSKNLTNLQIYLARSGTTVNLTNTIDSNLDFLTIKTKKVLSPGLYYLFISYDGTFSPSGTPGLYKSAYKNRKGEIRFFAATQLLGKDARKVFPCFDEPWIKATFNFSAVVPKGLTVLSNTLQNNVVEQLSNHLELVTFKSTPSMSTNAVAFVISDFTCSTINDDVLYRVCSRPDFDNEREYALDTSTKLLKYFENFTKVPYNTSRINKLDLVALPDRGVPSWGIPTFQEPLLLWNDTSNFYKQKVLTSISRQISSMWFDNLVTAESWSDSFLHDGLNKYFQYFAAAEIETGWELDKQFIVSELHPSLLEDSYGTSFSLLEKFDDTMTTKGASIIRMVTQAIGLEQFQLGIEAYLQNNMFGSTSSDDFWNSLQNCTNLVFPLTDIAHNWVVLPEYPLLNVARNGTDVIITQEPFKLFGKNNSSTRWYVPITYTTSRTESSEIWLTPDYEGIVGENKILNETDWIVLNNQQFGYYRVNYDEDLWSRISSILQKNHTKINPINRCQIIDDLFNLARADRITYSKVFDLISFLANDTDYYSWYSAFDGFANILARIRSSDVRQKLMNHIRLLMEKVYESVPLDDEQADGYVSGLKQALVFTWACKLNYSDSREVLKKYFLNYKNGNEIPKNLEASVFCHSLRDSDYIEEDSYLLWNQFRESNSPSQRVTLLSALGCIPKKTILNKFLQFAIESSTEVQKLESLEFFKSVIDNPEGANVILHFLIDNYDKIYDFYQDEKIIATIIKALGNMFTEESQIDKLSTLLQNGKVTERVKRHLENVLILAKNNLKFSETLQDGLSEYFSTDPKPLEQKSGSGQKSKHLCLFFTVLFYIMFLN